MITRLGTPVRLLAGNYPSGSVITTGQLNGRNVDPDTHLGFLKTP